MQEEWQDLKDFPGYGVSNFGSVANMERDVILTPIRNREGIAKVNLYKDGRQTSRSIAVLVARSFVPQETDYFNAPIHRNGDRMDCHAENLLWRPRWHAIHFHRQFHMPGFRRQIRLENLKTGERYRYLADPCIQYGLRYQDVIISYSQHEPAFPTGHEYKLL